jgi:hypothetical protein
MDTTSLRRSKPGWLSRVFGIETGSLVACDATWDGARWCRGDSFRFLFRGRLGHFFFLTTEIEWKEISSAEAMQHYDALPVTLLTRTEAFPEGDAALPPPEPADAPVVLSLQ